MKTVYLHMGLGKTGTTIIQKYLGKNYLALLEHGIHYIQSSGGTQGVGHQNFAKSFITKIPGYMQKTVNNDASARIAIKEEMQACKEDVVLISSENFQLAEPEKVKCFFDSIGEKLQYKIILFVRSQDELAESEYNQIIKVRKEERAFYNYVKSEFDGDFMRLAYKWEKVFGENNIICKVYDAKNHMALSDFFTCLPGNINIFKNVNGSMEETSNRSLGYAQMIIKRMLNTLHPSEVKNEHVELPRNIHEVFKAIDVPALLMNSKEAKKFRDLYKKSNKKFNKRYLGIRSSELGGRRYSADERNHYFQKCKDLIDIYKG